MRRTKNWPDSSRQRRRRPGCRIGMKRSRRPSKIFDGGRVIDDEILLEATHRSGTCGTKRRKTRCEARSGARHRERNRQGDGPERKRRAHALEHRSERKALAAAHRVDALRGARLREHVHARSREIVRMHRLAQAARVRDVRKHAPASREMCDRSQRAIEPGAVDQRGSQHGPGAIADGPNIQSISELHFG